MEIAKGLNLEKEKKDKNGTEWKFGVTSQSCLIVVPRTSRALYLPAGERQNIGEEKFDCASRGPLNILEAKFNYAFKNKLFKPENLQWLMDKGYVLPDCTIEFSDRFVAINSGTTAEGNSLKAPLDAIRKQGLVPKKLFPQVPSFAEYYDASKITQELKDLGLEFLSRFSINYDVVDAKDLHLVLDKDFQNTGGFAWSQPIGDIYPPTDNGFNHCFIEFDYFLDQYTDAFDNYQGVDGTFIKKLAPNYPTIEYGYRVWLSGENVPEKKTKDLNYAVIWLNRLIRGIISIWT